MRLSMLMPYGRTNFHDAVDLVVELEAAGLDLVWVAEPYGFDAPTALGFLAARTSTVQLGAGILPIYSRTPTLTAMTAAGLDQVSGGRAVLGLGASGPQVIEGWHGVPYDRPVGRTREIIDVCRKVLRREVLEHQGDNYQIPLPPGRGTGLGKPLRLISAPVRPSVPIFVAALGSANVRMAAEVADGWMPLFYAPRWADKVFGESLRAGSAARADDLAPLEICAGGIVAIGRNVDHLLDAARPQAALYIGGMGARGKNFYNKLFASYGYEREATLIQDLYLAGRKAEAEAAVPVEFLRETSLVGDRAEVSDRLQMYRDSGVTILDVQPVGQDPADVVRELKELL